ncbi:GtrA family protein [Devosia sp. SL43]|uniref:GtrA family protein n=1 Tax=Devosia sp. SL43 TaxID=2806348 RepID=UPI001F3B5DF6|nr:GtrA family protein [Devosia sp. SL43]UJW86564.1 GtrA family protein [Devosia sp. SL43]
MLSFARYLLTAGIATCVDVAIVQGLLFLDLLHNPLFLALAMTAGGLAGVTVNFLLSRRFVFAPDTRPVHQQFLTFAVVAFSGLGLRLLLAYAFVAVFALPAFGWLSALPVPAVSERVAHLIAVVLVTAYSFLAHKHISFAGGVSNRLPGQSTVVP